MFSNSRTQAKVMPVYWAGKVPTTCQWCEEHILEEFVDGMLVGSVVWAVVCKHCHSEGVVELGVGKGQRYVQQADGRWLKVLELK